MKKQANALAAETVDLLGHHPSLAIWCAHDDPNPTPVAEFMSRETKLRRRARKRQVRRQEMPSWNRSVLDRGLRRTIRKTDPSRLVIASSGIPPHPPQMDGSDTHLWLGWYHGKARDIGHLSKRWPKAVRFVSEFGAQAVPTRAIEYLGSADW
ncbi:MAG: hypothetical protein ACC652_12230, partial [Acidimicrobiales bacterium]